MPHYLVEVGYTPESWAAQLKNPQDVRERITPSVESLGGRLEILYYAFGEHDAIVIVEFPDDGAAAAWAMVAHAGGATRSVRTTPLMTIEDAMATMQRAATASGVYRPPS